jgi:hypothetical protein
MVWYFAVVAVVNIGLGYALATYLSTVRERNSSVYSAVKSTSDQVLDDDEYYSDEPYDEDLEGAELASAR